MWPLLYSHQENNRVVKDSYTKLYEPCGVNKNSEKISKKYQVKKVVLFGSRARGTNMPKSDIDLAIYGCADFGGLSDSLNEDLWSLLKLDIINMDDKYVSSELVSEIEKDGVVLYEKV